MTTCVIKKVLNINNSGGFGLNAYVSNAFKYIWWWN